MSERTAASATVSRPCTTTLTPSCANNLAIAAPIPRDLPVTSATFPSRTLPAIETISPRAIATEFHATALTYGPRPPLKSLRAHCELVVNTRRRLDEPPRPREDTTAQSDSVSTFGHSRRANAQRENPSGCRTVAHQPMFQTSVRTSISGVAFSVRWLQGAGSSRVV